MLYLLLNIHKRLSNVPERPVISNCETPSEKFSEFLDHHLQPVMKGRKSYKKDTADFVNKLKDLDQIPEGSIIITAGMVGLYPSIPHTEGLEVLRKQYGKFLHNKVPTEDIIKMADFALKKGFNSNFSNKYLELLSVLKRDTQQNKIENRIPLVVSYNPAFRVYLQHCEKTVLSFTQMQRLERFLHQIHLLLIEALENLRVFS